MSVPRAGYLCYDIRGIQSFIFQIPRLRYIIGGSALVDRFDRQTIPQLARERGWNLACAGGGKGAFAVGDTEEAISIQDAVLSEAHAIGLDIRFGRNPDFSEAAHCADRLFPYLPASLDGHPCPESGLYPTASGIRVHPTVARRLWDQGDKMNRWFETRLFGEKAGGLELPECLRAEQLTFFRNTDADDPDGRAGSVALGSRNRWAVICMDGNDMGSQFRAMSGKRTEDAVMRTWVREMGSCLDDCSLRACRAGIARVLSEWASADKVRRQLELGGIRDGDGAVVIPVRPLVVGGDDIAVLCHASHAASFVIEACRVFSDTSALAAKQAATKGLDLWPGTAGRVTISAGILYCGSSLPLATAIPYTESLLAIAKAHGRQKTQGRVTGPSPAYVDFESVTESMIDHPLSRRRRETAFVDGDTGERVELTSRPYTLDGFDALVRNAERFAESVPRSIAHQLLPSMRAGRADRQLFRARLGKHQGWLHDALAEPNGESAPSPDSRWKRGTSEGKACIRTDLLDLFLLAQEGHRMAQETAQ